MGLWGEVAGEGLWHGITVPLFRLLTGTRAPQPPPPPQPPSGGGQGGGRRGKRGGQQQPTTPTPPAKPTGAIQQALEHASAEKMADATRRSRLLGKLADPNLATLRQYCVNASGDEAFERRMLNIFHNPSESEIDAILLALNGMEEAEVKALLDLMESTPIRDWLQKVWDRTGPALKKADQQVATAIHDNITTPLRRFRRGRRW